MSGTTTSATSAQTNTVQLQETLEIPEGEGMGERQHATGFSDFFEERANSPDPRAPTQATQNNQNSENTQRSGAPSPTR